MADINALRVLQKYRLQWADQQKTFVNRKYTTYELQFMDHWGEWRNVPVVYEQDGDEVLDLPGVST